MLKRPHVFECACGQTRNSPDSHIPVGWSQSPAGIWCSDCTAAGIPQRELARRDRRTRRAA